MSDVFDTSKWRVHSNKGDYDIRNYSKEATHAYWIGLSFHFNSRSPANTPDDPHPPKRSPVRLGQ